MIVYLDQNKWIELARIYHGKDKTQRSISLLKEIDASIDLGYIFPLSAIHYLEFSRISNPKRRARLGEVMWKYSKGKTLISSREIVEKEVEHALKIFFPSVNERSISIVGNGMEHAFGEKWDMQLPNSLNDSVEKAMLTGINNLNIEPISFSSNEHRENFTSHLKSLQNTKLKLEKSKWRRWVYAIAIKDIMRPLYDVMRKHKLPVNSFENFTSEQYAEFVDAMPTRALDVHLHHQVLKNSNYKPKISDLEDWAGLGVAACYADIVVCEKHFSSMLKRDKYKTKARVETDLYNIFETLKSPNKK